MPDLYNGESSALWYILDVRPHDLLPASALSILDNSRRRFRLQFRKRIAQPRRNRRETEQLKRLYVRSNGATFESLGS